MPPMAGWLYHLKTLRLQCTPKSQRSSRIVLNANKIAPHKTTASATINDINVGSVSPRLKGYATVRP